MPRDNPQRLSQRAAVSLSHQHKAGQCRVAFSLLHAPPQSTPECGTTDTAASRENCAYEKLDEMDGPAHVRVAKVLAEYGCEMLARLTSTRRRRGVARFPSTIDKNPAVGPSIRAPIRPQSIPKEKEGKREAGHQALECALKHGRGGFPLYSDNSGELEESINTMMRQIKRAPPLALGARFGHAAPPATSID